MAGGRSSRFGRDKLAELYEGRPLIHHALLALDEVCGEILVVMAPDADSPETPREVVAPVRVVRDAEPHAGPLAGLAAGLAETDTPLALVVGGDMPGLMPEVLVELILTASEERVEAAVVTVGGEARPLPCVVHAEALGTAERLLASGERSLRELLASLETRGIPEERWRLLDPAGATLRDVDTPADLGYEGRP